MAVTYTTALKTTRMDAVGTAIDAGGAAGKLEILDTNGTTVVATIPLKYPSPSAASGELDLTAGATFTLEDTSADATGTATTARIRTSADADVITGLTVSTVAAATGDIRLDSTSITATQTVTLNSASITHG